MSDGGDVVNRNQLQRIHEQNPDEDGQRQGCNQRVAAMKGVADCVVDELDDHFNRIDEAAGNAGGGLSGDTVEHPAENDAEADGPGHGVDVNGGEPHGGGFGTAVRHHPGAAVANNGAVIAFVPCRQLAIGQVGQVVDNVI